MCLPIKKGSEVINQNEAADRQSERSEMHAMSRLCGGLGNKQYKPRMGRQGDWGGWEQGCEDNLRVAGRIECCRMKI